jgi:hypothetical protein
MREVALRVVMFASDQLLQRSQWSGSQHVCFTPKADFQAWAGDI